MAAVACRVCSRIDFVVWACVRAWRAAVLDLALYVESSVEWEWVCLVLEVEMWRRTMWLRINLCMYEDGVGGVGVMGDQATGTLWLGGA